MKNCNIYIRRRCRKKISECLFCVHGTFYLILHMSVSSGVMMEISESTFKIYFRELYPQLAFFASRFVDGEEVEDVVQDSFVALWNNKNRMNDVEHVRMFLFRSVYNNSLNVIKHRKISQGYAAEAKKIALRKMEYYAAELNDAAEDVEKTELKKQIDDAVNTLPDKMRQVFVMSYMHDMKNKDIADIMGVSVRTVEAHLYKAIKHLRSRLGYLMFYLFLFYLIH